MKQLRKHPDFDGLSKIQRLDALNKTADKRHDSYTYIKPLTEDEIAAINEKINQALNEIERLKEDRKELSSLIKDQNETVISSNKKVIAKSEEVNEMIWEIIDTAEKRVYKINSDGYIIDESRIKGGEQVSVFNNQKDAM